MFVYLVIVYNPLSLIENVYTTSTSCHYHSACSNDTLILTEASGLCLIEIIAI